MWHALVGIALAIGGCASVKLEAPAPTTQPAAAFLVLRNTRTIDRIVGAIARNLPGAHGIQTMDCIVSGDAIVATRDNEVLLVRLGGGPPVSLLRHPTEVRFATRSRDGKSLAFSADGGVWLASAKPDGTFGDPQRITNEFGYGPSFSSDGRFVYFEGDKGLKRYARETATIEPFLPDQPKAHTVRCSPDGRFIAFSRARALYLYHTDDRSVRKLTDGRAYDRFASFAGDRVLFFRESSDAAGRSIRSAMSIRTDGWDQRELLRGDVELVCALHD
jgi:dipeptidyl aminopeptidase/acylaminoacyl peptidase